MAEPLPPQQSEEISVRAPDGTMGTIPKSQLWSAIQQGYSESNPDLSGAVESREKYGGIGQQAITALEAAASAVSFGASTGVERLLGASPEDIQGRREENPLTHGAGTVAGLGASLLVPVYGEANVLRAAGMAGAKALIPGAKVVYEAEAALTAARALGKGAEATQAVTAAKAALDATKTARPFLAKIGTPAAEQLIENSLFQVGDEVSKMFSGAPGYENPRMATETAISNIGLSGLIGGGVGAGFGALSPLWKATLGRQAETFLGALKNRADGITVHMPQSMETALAGIEIPAEIRAGLSEDPMMRTHFQSLVESGTQPGEALRETLAKFQSDVGEQLKGVFDTGEKLSAFDAGEAAKSKIFAKAEELDTAIRAKYDAINPSNEYIIIPDKARLKFYDGLIKQGQEFGSAGSPAEGLFKHYGERALAQDSIAQLDKLRTELGSAGSVAKRAGDFENARALGDIREAIKNFQETQIGKAAEAAALGAKAGDVEGAKAVGKQLIADRKVASDAYRSFIEHMGDIASVGKLGKARSFGQFQEALEKVPSAKFAEKLFDKKNIEGLNFLKKEFPDVIDSLIKQNKSKIIEDSSKAGDLLHNTLLEKVSKLPAEVKSLMFTKEELNIIESSGKILRQSHKRMSPSGSPRGLDQLWKHMPAGVGGVVGALVGGNPLYGALIGAAGKYLARDAPDAIKLSLLKFLGSTGPVDGQAWKVASDFINHTYKGQRTIDRASKAVFKSSAPVLSRPSQNDRDKLIKKLDKLKTDQRSLFEVGGKTAHYLPAQGTALGEIAVGATNYLNSIRPALEKKNPLDSEIKETPAQKSEFARALDIAEQPLIVLEDVKEGTITTTDLIHLKSLYPSLYSQLQQKITNDMIEAVNDEEVIPYKTRMGLSLFLAQPMDSTMTPESIMALNPPPLMDQQQGPAPAKSGGSMKNLDKVGKENMTAAQSRESRKMNRA